MKRLIERLGQTNFRQIGKSLLRSCMAILLAYGISFLLILVVSDEPANAIHWFIVGPFTNITEFSVIFKNAMPLIFAGIASALIIRCGQFNMFTEGAFYMGGLVAAVVAIYSGMNGFLSIAAALIAAGIASGIVGYLPAKLKAKYEVNEFVSSIMLNYIVLWVGVWLISNVIIDVTSGDNATSLIPDSSRLLVLFASSDLTIGLPLAFLFVLLVHFFMYRTKWGFELRIVGDNRKFARTSGINDRKSIVLSQVLGVIIAGIGGGVEILSNYRRFRWKTLPGYGFDGFMVSIMARNKPLLVPFAAIFIGYLRAGADLMAFNTDVTSEMVQVIQGLIIIFVAAEAFFSQNPLKNILLKFKERRTAKEVMQHE